MGKDKALIVIGLGIVAILFLAFFAGGSKGIGGGGNQNGEVINCEVQLKNPAPLGNVKIISASCAREQCGFFDTLTIFGAEGNIRMKVDGKIVDTQSYDWSLLSTSTKVFDLKSSDRKSVV